MPRGRRNAPGGIIQHVLNRANGRDVLFETPHDYQAFVSAMAESLVLVPIRILAYCLMPNHWHFVLWPERDGQLSKFMHHLTTTHVRRWHKFHGTEGRGHVYQGPFKSFPVQNDEHFYTVCRYVERNAVRARLTDNVKDWVWGSVWAREHPLDERALLLAEWPLPRPSDWIAYVNQALTAAELSEVRSCLREGNAYATESWQRENGHRFEIQKDSHKIKQLA